MCIYYYHGYTCGHVKEKAPPIPPTLCRRHSRLPHEPMCNPPIYSIRHLEGEIRCPGCEDVHRQCGERWTSIKNEWRRQKILPESVIQELSRERVRTMMETTKTGMREGPSHMTQRILNIATVTAVIKGDDLVKELIDSDKDWESNIKRIDREFMTKEEIRQVEWMKKRLEKIYSDDVKQMVSQTGQLLSNVYDITSNRRRPAVEDDMKSFSLGEFLGEE